MPTFTDRDDPAWSQAWEAESSKSVYDLPAGAPSEAARVGRWLCEDPSGRLLVTRCREALVEGDADACLTVACSLLLAVDRGILRPPGLKTPERAWVVLVQAGFLSVLVTYLAQASYPTEVRSKR